MTSSLDHEMSDSSGSSYSNYDFFYSPSQQVPELTNGLTGLSCGENNDNSPYLVITEQPQNHFRFRYVSEMVGTHGCILGKSAANNKTKTHPSVELRNFNGIAVIKCQLVQNKNDSEHPHKLLVEDQEQERDVSYRVPERGCYKVGFAGMGIIHTAKKDVPELLYNKYKFQPNLTQKEIKAKCDAMAKTIDLNIVRLKFSAYDASTGEQLCKPVFSEPIHNMKSASTNDLKICRMSKATGRPSGGDDVFIFVEKVNKKNIQVIFYEEDESGKTKWEAQASFIQSDVHHQYGIVFRTPPYENTCISNDVTVNVRLRRPSDGRTSEPNQFKYKAEPIYKNNKKRKVNSNFSSYSSVSDTGSINSINNLPATLMNEELVTKMKIESPETFQNIPSNMSIPSPNQCDLGDAMMGGGFINKNSMWCDTTPLIPAEGSLPHIQLDSTELNNLLQDRVSEEDRNLCFDYLSSIDSMMSNIGEKNEILINHLPVLQLLEADSGRYKNMKSDGQKKAKLTADAQTKTHDIQTKTQPKPGTSNNKESIEYSAFYTAQDGLKVKKLVNELYELMKSNAEHKNPIIRDKLESLFKIRLSNGDTFLHMTLLSNQPSFKNIVKIIHNVNMSHLFDYDNFQGQTILHVAIAYNMDSIVPLLIGKGCNPMAKDKENDTAVHYAVRSQSCLKPLLRAIKQYQVPCDLNECNDKRQSPLHLCTSGESVRLLVAHGASCSVRDIYGRLPLHLAALDDNLSVTEALLENTSTDDVDVQDDSGNTALQIVCEGRPRQNTLALVRLLLEKKANPWKSDKNSKSAWSRASGKPALREIIEKYRQQGDEVKSEPEDDIKSEPDDDYESAEENEWIILPEMCMYEYELSAELDKTGGWRTLADHLRLNYCAWFSAQPSAARTLLSHIKECRVIPTSQILATVLEDIGEVKAANIIKRYLN